jgi:hypothetical protein
MKTKQEAHRLSLISQRDIIESYAYDTQKIGDARVVGPVIAAYGVVLRYLDDRIDALEQQLGGKK